MKDFHGFTDEDCILDHSRVDTRPFVWSDSEDEDDKSSQKKAKLEDKPCTPPPISTVPELPENTENEPFEAKALPASHYLVRVYHEADAVIINDPTISDLMNAFPILANLPPPPPTPPSVVKEESKVVTQEINPAFVPKHQCFYRGFQTEIKERTIASLQLSDSPVSGYLMVGIIHDHVDLVKKPIIGRLGPHRTPNFTPFTVKSTKNPDSTSYEPFEVEYIGKVYGAIVPLDAEDQVHFKFPVLSSDPKNEGKKKIGKSWSLLVYLAKTRMSFINSQEMSKYGKFLDIQVFSEVRPQRSLKFDPRPGKFKYPKYKDDDQLSGFNLKQRIEKCRKRWGDIALDELLKNLLEFDEKNLTPEEQ